MQKHTPVLIVGAGPTGLTLATELHRHGISFRLIDKQIKPVSTSNALGVQSRTLEIWDDEGLLENALSHGIKIKTFNLYAKKKKIVNTNFDILPCLHPFILSLPQSQTEKMLIEYLKKQNISPEMNVELINFTQQEAGISATLLHLNGEQEVMSADWIIGCDGGQSIVRKNANIDFIGQELPQHFVLADVKIKSDLRSNVFTGFFSEHGILAIIPFNKKYMRIIADVTADPELGKAKTLTSEQVKSLIANRYPFPFEMDDLIWTSGFWIHERMASAFRQNKIFLAGDAAHIHSPVGGQGLNTGIQDSYNLAWKLALVIKKKAHPRLLESYYLERGPVAKAVLKETTTLTKIMTLRNPILCAIRNFLFLYLTKIKKIQKKIISQISELSIHYHQSPYIKDYLSNYIEPSVGTLMPATEELNNLTRGTEHCILFFSDEDFNVTNCIQLTEIINKKYNHIFKFILISTQNEFTSWKDLKIYDENKILHEKFGIKVPSIYLIRPDKYISFRSTFSHVNQFLKYLQSIFY
jgi:2-polyprenyl-6-methoxyphenol hydroxylase-like FAD-dependent oxidoreductase